MAQLDHEPVLVEGDLVDDDALSVSHPGEHVPQGEVEATAPAGGDHVGRQWPLDLLDEDRSPRGDLEGRCRVLVEELREGPADHLAEPIVILEERREVALDPLDAGDGREELEYLL